MTGEQKHLTYRLYDVFYVA